MCVMGNCAYMHYIIFSFKSKCLAAQLCVVRVYTGVTAIFL